MSRLASYGTPFINYSPRHVWNAISKRKITTNIAVYVHIILRVSVYGCVGVCVRERERESVYCLLGRFELPNHEWGLFTFSVRDIFRRGIHLSNFGS